MRENVVIPLHKFLWVAYVLALILGSLIPVEVSGAPEQGDKVVHCLAYGLLVFLWPAAWKCSPVSMFCLASGLGLLLELGQGILPTGRFLDPWDAVANALGAGIGVGVVFLRSRSAEGTLLDGGRPKA